MNSFDLKQLRKDIKLSQKALSEQLGIGQSFISQIENGKDPMPNSLISKIKEIYQLDDVSNYFITKTEKNTICNDHQNVDSKSINEFRKDLEIAKLTITHLEQRLKDKEEIIELLRLKNPYQQKEV